MKLILKISSGIVHGIRKFAIEFGLLLVGVLLLMYIYDYNIYFGIGFTLFILIDALEYILKKEEL